MKIWKAELILFYTLDNKYDIRFNFEEQEEDYKENKKFNEWTYFENWVGYRIPMDMIIENESYSALKVVQGFDHELNETELKQLEKDMRKLMEEKIENDKERYLKEYENKLIIIRG